MFEHLCSYSCKVFEHLSPYSCKVSEHLTIVVKCLSISIHRDRYLDIFGSSTETVSVMARASVGLIYVSHHLLCLSR